MDKSQPVGVFDSGVGGLTVVAELYRQLPREAPLYFGDTLHVPYGPRPPEELVTLADAITGFLLQAGAKAIVDACNSTSAVALDFLRQKYGLPVVGVVEPGVEEAIRLTKNGRVGLLATEATVRSGAHSRAAACRNAGVQVFSQACPRFVTLVETGQVWGPLPLRLARYYLRPLQEAGVDVVILGCTHYPFLSPVLRQVLGPQVLLVDPAAATVRLLAGVLEDSGLLAEGDAEPGREFFVSANPPGFARVGERLLGWPGGLAGVKLGQPAQWGVPECVR